MSAVLETVNAFSRTLADELADAVKAQDAMTVQAFDDILMRLANARDAFLAGLNATEDAYEKAMTDAIKARSAAMGELGIKLENAFAEVLETVEETRTRYAPQAPAPLPRVVAGAGNYA